MTQEKPLRLAHISDLHFGKMCYTLQQFFSKQWLGSLNFACCRRFTYLKKQAHSLFNYFQQKNIHDVVITGDLSTSSSELEFQEALSFVQQLKKMFTTYVIPGNHDLFTFFFSRFPQIEYISKNFKKIPSTFAQLVNYKLCHYQNDLDIFYGRFEASFQNVVNLPGNRPGQYPFIKTLDRDVALIGLETNQLPQFPLNLFCSMGYLDPETTSEILERPELKDKIKIVLIHHHLQPGKEVALKVGRFSSASMGFVNKDEILVLLKKYQVDLVLHGHYHTNQSYSVDGLEVIGNGNPLCWSLIETIGDQYTVSHECERKKRSSHFLLQSLEETF